MAGLSSIWRSTELVVHLLYQARYYLIAISCVVVILRLSSIIRFTVHTRRRYKDIPSLPRNPVWGNLINCGEKLAGNRHPDYGFEEMWEALERPPCFLMDLAPIEGSFLMLAEPQMAEALVSPSKQYKYSLPKSDTYDQLSRLIGAESLLTEEGEDWKHLRKRFNPGFQPKHILSLAPSIIAKTKIFVERLELAASDGRTFALGDYAKDLTTDIITQLTLERDFPAQSIPEGQGEKGLFGILRASRRLSELVFKVGEGLNLPQRLDLIRPIKNKFYES